MTDKIQTIPYARIPARIGAFCRASDRFDRAASNRPPANDTDRIQRIRHELIHLSARHPTERAELDEIEGRLLMVEDRIAKGEST
jgi:hypothetical protein